MRKLILILVLSTLYGIASGQSNPKRTPLPANWPAFNKGTGLGGQYEFSLVGGEMYKIRVFEDGTLMGGDRNDKGTWKKVSNTVILSWDDLPSWRCRIQRNKNGIIIGLVDSAGNFIKRISLDPFAPIDVR